ncbi:MAG: FtsX-like permease family protein [Candidatus Atribacteria bacterium]|nr:FtsX-like permease family protein [Candidatus Atribacteria bacterium]
MNVYESLRTSISSLVSNKLRSFLTMLGIIIGVAAVVSMISLGTGVRTSIVDQIGSLGSNLLTVVGGAIRQRPGMPIMMRGMSNILKIEHFRDLEAMSIPGIQSIIAESSLRQTVVFGRNNTSVSIIGTTANYPIVRNFNPTMGRFFSDYEYMNLNNYAVIGDTVAIDLFGDINKAIGNRIRIGRVNFEVIGVMEKKSMGSQDLGNQIFIPLTTLQKRLTGSRYLQSITIQADSAENMNSISQSVEQFFLRKLGDIDRFTIMNQQDILDTINQVTGTITLFLGAITGISLLVGGIGIMNIMLVSVTERTREIGLRKAIGARPSDILFQFMVESSVLSCLGGILGIIFGAIGAKLIGNFTQWTTKVSFSSIVISFGVSLAVGLFFGILPARRASKLDPITALRYE